MKNARYLSISIATSLDQVTKYAIAHGPVARARSPLPGFARLAYGENTGALSVCSVGAAALGTIVLLIVPALAIVLVTCSWASGEKGLLILVALRPDPRRSARQPGRSHLPSRKGRGLHRRPIDFDPVRGWLERMFGSSHWPAFNIADSAIDRGPLLAFDPLPGPSPLMHPDLVDLGWHEPLLGSTISTWDLGRPLRARPSSAGSTGSGRPTATGRSRASLSSFTPSWPASRLEDRAHPDRPGLLPGLGLRAPLDAQSGGCPGLRGDRGDPDDRPLHVAARHVVLGRRRLDGAEPGARAGDRSPGLPDGGLLLRPESARAALGDPLHRSGRGGTVGNAALRSLRSAGRTSFTQRRSTAAADFLLFLLLATERRSAPSRE